MTTSDTPVLVNILLWVVGYFAVGLVLWIVTIGYLALTAASRAQLDDAFESSNALIIPIWPIMVLAVSVWLIENAQDKLKSAIIRWRKL
jgi:hypothetical protein